MTTELVKSLLKFSKMHDEIEAAREKLKKMKAEYKQDAYEKRASELVKTIVEKGVELREQLFDKVGELEQEREVLRETQPEPKRFDLNKIYTLENGERKVNTEYLTNLPILQNYITQQLEAVQGVDGYKEILDEILTTTEHDIVMYDALKNAIETFYPTWYTPAAHAAHIRDAASFEFDMARMDALKKLEYATGAPSEKARFDRMVAIDNEIKELEEEVHRMGELDDFRGEFALDVFGHLQTTDTEKAQSLYFGTN